MFQTVTLQQHDKDFPGSIKKYKKTPQKLYCAGDTSLLKMPMIAIVGTRTPTQYGKRLAFDTAAYFASQGYGILSGLAKGCDTEAHKGALSVGGKTVAVLGTSLAKMYPRENTGLAERIVVEGGLLITSYAYDAYAPVRFVERDWLQAAFSLAVLPIQAGYKSGTLHSCKAAMEYQRLLFLPIPDKEDAEKFPACYDGIYQLIRKDKGHVFTVAEEYPHLLELLQEKRQQLMG